MISALPSLSRCPSDQLNPAFQRIVHQERFRCGRGHPQLTSRDWIFRPNGQNDRCFSRNQVNQETHRKQMAGSWLYLLQRLCVQFGERGHRTKKEAHAKNVTNMRSKDRSHVASDARQQCCCCRWWGGSTPGPASSRRDSHRGLCNLLPAPRRELERQTRSSAAGFRGIGIIMVIGPADGQCSTFRQPVK